MYVLDQVVVWPSFNSYMVQYKFCCFQQRFDMLTGFNSYMVQFKHLLNLMPLRFFWFRFLYGAIQINLSMPIPEPSKPFQFLSGSIHPPNSISNDPYLNKFQFLYGAIQDSF